MPKPRRALKPLKRHVRCAAEIVDGIGGPPAWRGSRYRVECIDWIVTMLRDEYDRGFLVGYRTADNDRERAETEFK